MPPCARPAAELTFAQRRLVEAERDRADLKEAVRQLQAANEERLILCVYPSMLKALNTPGGCGAACPVCGHRASMPRVWPQSPVEAAEPRRGCRHACAAVTFIHRSPPPALALLNHCGVLPADAAPASPAKAQDGSPLRRLARSAIPSAADKPMLMSTADKAAALQTAQVRLCCNALRWLVVRGRQRTPCFERCALCLAVFCGAQGQEAAWRSGVLAGNWQGAAWTGLLTRPR